MTAENVKKQMTDEEWQKVYDMSKDKNLYQNLCSSLFPTIHGKKLSYFPYEGSYYVMAQAVCLLWHSFEHNSLQLSVDDLESFYDCHS